jgi:hypothetical protein
MAGEVIPASGPAPVIMPPIAVGPPGDPYGLGPTAGNGPPPGPMYPVPGPYAAPQFQPPPPLPTEGLGAGNSGSYGSAPRVEFDGAYLLWFNRPQSVPFPLFTTSAPSQNGLIGANSTIVLAGAQNISYSAINGMRLTGSFYGDEDRRFGALVSGFYTATAEYRQHLQMQPPSGANSFGVPLLARPYIDNILGPTSLVLGSPTIGVANASLTTASQIWGVEGSGLWNIYRSSGESKCWNSLDMVVGYKYLQLNERFDIQSLSSLTGSTSTPIFGIGANGLPVQTGVLTVPTQYMVGGVSVTSPGTVQVTDRFTTTNQFNGVTLGLRSELRYGMWNLNTFARLGMGVMHETLQVYGSTAFTSGATGQYGSAYGGLFANASNIGTVVRDEFAVIPEISINLGLNVTRTLTAYVGYNFLYINQVARPGNQINPVVDGTSVPFSPSYGTAGIAPSRMGIAQSEYWIMGANFGFAFRY